MGYNVCLVFWGGGLVYISGKGSEKCQVEIIRENIVSSKGSRLDCNNLFPVPHEKKKLYPFITTIRTMCRIYNMTNISSGIQLTP